MRSDLVALDWRPVPLKEGVYDYGRIIFYPDNEVTVLSRPRGRP